MTVLVTFGAMERGTLGTDLDILMTFLATIKAQALTSELLLLLR